MNKFGIKKYGATVLSVLIIAAALFTDSCKKNEAVSQGNGEATFNIKRKAKSKAVETIRVTANEGRTTFDSMASFFDLDFSAEEPEDFQTQNDTSSAKDKKSKKDKESTSVIPKIRKLDEYKTKYSSERKKFNIYSTEKKQTEITPNIIVTIIAKISFKKTEFSNNCKKRVE